MNNKLTLLYEFTDELMDRLSMKIEKVFLNAPLSEHFDLGLRSMLGHNVSLDLSGFSGISFDGDNDSIIYYLRDEYACSYILLPHIRKDEPMLLIGPYVTEVPEIREIRRIFREQRITNEQLVLLLQYYGTLPCIRDEGILYTYIDVLARHVQGDNVNIQKIRISTARPKFEQTAAQDNMIRMQNLEKKYQIESLLMERIAAGDESGAKKAFSGIRRFSFDARSSDTISSRRYYLGVMNTLCRKAAQRADVHPYFLDETSRQMSVRILKSHDMKELGHLYDEMITEYCILVQKHGVGGLSRTVSDAVNYINASLNQQNLSLAAIAEEMNISKSYLSSRFSDEMHMTVTDYITKKRIEHAQELLENTTMPVQDIASLNGYDDAAYFTRLFRKKTGISPREYRKKTVREKKN